MTTTTLRESTSTNPALSASELGELLTLLRGADSVEVKASVPDTDHRSIALAFGLDPLEAQIRQVAFFDTPDLALSEDGVVVRARRVQGRCADTTVKLRPVIPNELSPELRKSPSFGVEVDAMPGGFVCSASMKGEVDDAAVRSAFTGTRPLRKLLDKQQRAFYRAHASPGIDLDDLAMLGPINVLKLKFRPPEFDRRIVAELWLYPDGSRLLELSAKAKPGEAFQVAAATKALLAAKGVDLSAAQQTKTKKALAYFARERAISEEK